MYVVDWSSHTLHTMTTMTQIRKKLRQWLLQGGSISSGKRGDKKTKIKGFDLGNHPLTLTLTPV